MKTILHLLLLLSPLVVQAQITSPVVRARFGVDADLRANYFGGSVLTGNDDWFNFTATDTLGKAVIDTTGARSIIAGYLSDASPWPSRMASFYRGMSRAPFSIVNNRLWLDALYVRDYHGTDTTVYSSGSDKNGMSPEFWTGGIQSIPDKNDILDIMVHVRRAGPNATDSLWMFGGISMDNVVGNRYFDFEMYQTDIYYDRPSGRFYGYGPDEGHTSWTFDGSGNIITPGDIIFNGEFQSSTLTNIEARIWVKRSDWMTVTPTAFDWSGKFDGASSGSAYGYASISPKSSGAFYTGLGSANNTWAGPFGLVLQDNSLSYSNPGPASTTNSKYIAAQFIEFSINLTKLGLDPVTLLGGDACGTPFNRLIVKTRASASFTAELKDFVAPTDLFLSPRVEAEAETPYICDTLGFSTIRVTNPVSSSVYEWTTIDGSIIGNATGPVIYVDSPGTYIVHHYLQAGCNLFAADTVQVVAFANCMVLDLNITALQGVQENGSINLSWKTTNNQLAGYFEVERSLDGRNFQSVGRIDNLHQPAISTADYNFTDDVASFAGTRLYYRVKLFSSQGTFKFSNTIHFNLSQPRSTISIYPNPARDVIQVQVVSQYEKRLNIEIYDPSGRLVGRKSVNAQRGINIISMDNLSAQPEGIYLVAVRMDEEIFQQKVIRVR